MEAGELELLVSCEREWVADYKLENGYTIDSYGFDQLFNEKYMYKLTFLSCKLFESHISGYVLEYINARFKETIKLQQIIKLENRRYFHLRIQFSEGYLDIIFADFKIEKVTGDVIIPQQIINIVPFAQAINKFKGVPLEKIRNLSLNGNWLDRSLSIQYLSEVNDSSVLHVALQALNHEEDEVKLSAIHAIGKHASTDVIPLLLQMWLASDVDLFKKHIMDNIEKIVFRSTSKK